MLLKRGRGTRIAAEIAVGREHARRAGTRHGSRFGLGTVGETVARQVAAALLAAHRVELAAAAGGGVAAAYRADGASEQAIREVGYWVTVDDPSF